jgi:beta-fructofuranosidase
VTVSVTQEGAAQFLQAQIMTTSHKEPLILAVPVSLLSADRRHDLMLRYLGFRVELLCDGVLVDEEWPMGEVPFGSDAPTPATHEPVQKAQFLSKAPSDEALAARYGGPKRIAQRANEMLGPEPAGMEYMKPRGWNTNAGDAMPFYHDGTFHLFYLIDRRHHHSKWGLGAHQWAHISTTDLVHWTTYPTALPISHQWEGSICTGSVFFHDGTYYAFYATRMPDRKEHLNFASGTDGIHFTKVEPSAFSDPQAPFRAGPNRDPSVNRDGNNYLMLVTAALAAKKDGKEQGALEQLVSTDLKHWVASDSPFLVPGYSPQPECSDLFLWKGKYYLLFGVDGVTHYRIGNSLHGPWTKPDVDVLDANEARVMKTAAFRDDRRILVGWIGHHNFGGNLIFRELIQNSDGTLGTKFVNEMYPESGVQATVDLDGSGSLPAVPKPSGTKMSFVLKANASHPEQPYALSFQSANGPAEKLVIDASNGSVIWSDANGRVLDELRAVAELKQNVTVQIASVNDLVDVCVNGRRTMIHRLAAPAAEIALSSNKHP